MKTSHGDTLDIDRAPPANAPARISATAMNSMIPWCFAHSE